MMNRLSVTLAATFTGAMLASGAASAETVTADGGYGSGSYLTESVTATVGTSTSSGSAGLARYTRTNTGPTPLLTNTPLGVFYALCLEFNETIGSTVTGASWTLNALSAAPNDASNTAPVGGMGNARAADLARLLNGAYPNWGAPLTTVNVTALQLAVWEIANESTESSYNLLSGMFSVQQSSVDAASWTLANQYLANLVGLNPTFNDSTMYYRALTQDNQQDFVVKTVPLPAAAWLLLSGLAGLGFVGRRKAA